MKNFVREGEVLKKIKRARREVLKRLFERKVRKIMRGKMNKARLERRRVRGSKVKKDVLK